MDRHPRLLEVRRLALAAAAAAAALFSGPTAADEGDTPLSLRLPKGAALAVEQTLEVEGDVEGDRRGLELMKTPIRGRIKLTEQYTDEALAADPADAPTSVRRTFGSATVTAGKNAPKPTGLDRAVLVLEEVGGRTTVRAEKGSISKRPIAALERTPVDPIEVLLPEGPVAEGCEWTVEAAHVKALWTSILSGLSSAKGDVAKQLEGVLRQTAHGPVGVKVDSIRDGIASLSLTPGTSGSATVFSMSFSLRRKWRDAVFAVASRGTMALKFDVARGRPIELTWQGITAVIKGDVTTGGSDEFTLDGKVLEKGIVPGQMDGPWQRWTVTRRYSAVDR